VAKCRLEQKSPQSSPLCQAANYPDKGVFYPLFCWLIAPHVCKLAEVFYGHMIIFLKYFQIIKVSNQIEENWATKQPPISDLYSSAPGWSCRLCLMIWGIKWSLN